VKRLKIIIPHEKRYILSLLYDTFPCFAVDMSIKDHPIIFIATLEDTHDYFADLAWLKRIGLAYLDEKAEQEKVITDFFRGVIIEGISVAAVQFPESPDAHSDHFKVLLTMGDSVITLLFPHEWTPPKIV
jgi:hypothetical protein